MPRRIRKVEEKVEELEVQMVAHEVTGRPAGRYTRAIVTNASGRCAICDRVADHIHKEGAADGEVERTR